jgi:phosphomethylpyrimidine synthase
MTQLEKAKNNIITKEMKFVAKEEGVDAGVLMKRVSKGMVVIPKSRRHRISKLIGIGFGLRTKINSNIGTSPAKADLRQELKKLKISIETGTDTVMDLSTGGNINKIRREIIRHSEVPIGTVPIYQTVIDKGDILDLEAKDFLNGIKKHIEDGVDFITVHCGITKEAIPLVKKRLMGVVSRGGSFLIKWMDHNQEENPLYTEFDKILKMAKKYDVTLSLGDGLRPGCLKDATDEAQIHELKIIGKLVRKCWQTGVQVIVEGPGHIPLDQIKRNIELEKQICNGAPFYVLGPLVTDVTPGYDHITSAIGGALAAYYGADFLCYVTPKEHLGLPNIEDVREGVIASRIAAHTADIAKGISKAKDWDDEISKARTNLDWKEMVRLSINPERAKELREECVPKDPKVCSMCGKYCSIKISKGLK